MTRSFCFPFSSRCFSSEKSDYGHGFSSVFFFDTPEQAKIVLAKVRQFWQSQSLPLGLAVNADFHPGSEV